MLLTLLISYGALTARPRADNVWDFGAFHYAGFVLEEGGNSYSDASRADYEQRYGVLFTTVNLNPPPSLPWFSFLAKISPRAGFMILWVTNLVLYVGLVGMLARESSGVRGVRFLWALALTGFWQTLGMGQVYVLLLALLVLSYRTLRKQPWISGVALGVICAFKPQFALAPALLLMTGSWRVTLSAGLTCVAAWALALTTYGLDTIPAWLDAVRAYPHAVVSSNASVSTLLGRILPMPLVLLASVAVVAGAAWASLRARADRTVLDLGVALALVLSPVSWVGYTPLALPFLLRANWGAWLGAACMVLLVPANVIWRLDVVDGVQALAWLYPSALVVLAVHVFRQLPGPVVSASRD